MIHLIGYKDFPDVESLRVTFGHGTVAVGTCLLNGDVCVGFHTIEKHEVGESLPNDEKTPPPTILFKFDNVEGLDVLQKAINIARDLLADKQVEDSQ
ncbi:hypothetical protein NZD89_09225 [Alicyclobacillus fastidiosus]|uniref:Uncharacterized protein n=1 Tax=Alicyclobacillus fastidiosus TaxID=392011 RepID=A0ABY6ZKV6_9BACL|nr:hypothetical protein [Alicyclobacillus fastidiosus]WAH43538.1 hypothetical protein NZD89_09225 [Alicyclobacillus fastidiosus]GMA59711.1 hypothetical protein GCM10025859_01510 [Alicyclobacillus fastidiosus]GMA65560.1 hypothetical protein GCM10025859_60000 [Alicyclobacillus fastidiosus]